MNMINTEKMYKLFALEDKARNLVIQILGTEYFYNHIQKIGEIAEIVYNEASLPIKSKIMIATCLHDLVEDSNGLVTYEYICDEFNKEIAELVMELTKDNDGTFPRLHSIDGVTLKMIDRIVNLQSPKVSPETKQLYISTAVKAFDKRKCQCQKE